MHTHFSGYNKIHFLQSHNLKNTLEVHLNTNKLAAKSKNLLN